MTSLYSKVAPQKSLRRNRRKNVASSNRAAPEAQAMPEFAAFPPVTDTPLINYRVKSALISKRPGRFAEGSLLRQSTQHEAGAKSYDSRKQINSLTTVVREAVQLLASEAQVAADAVSIEFIDDTIANLRHIKEQIQICARQEVSQYQKLDCVVLLRGQGTRSNHASYWGSFPTNEAQAKATTAKVQAEDEDDPFAAARRRGEAYAAIEWSKPENITLDAAAALAGRADRVINQARKNGEYYALLKHGQSRGFRYPQWQFGVDHTRLAAALKPFHEAKTNCWVIHNFMNRPNSRLSGMRPCEYIADPTLPIEQVVTCAKESLPSDQGAA